MKSESTKEPLFLSDYKSGPNGCSCSKMTKADGLGRSGIQRLGLGEFVYIHEVLRNFRLAIIYSCLDEPTNRNE